MGLLDKYTYLQKYVEHDLAVNEAWAKNQFVCIGQHQVREEIIPVWSYMVGGGIMDSSSFRPYKTNIPVVPSRSQESFMRLHGQHGRSIDDYFDDVMMQYVKDIQKLLTNNNKTI